MYFVNFRDYSVKIGNYKKKLRLPSGKRLVHSVSGRHYDDRWRNAPIVFRKASETLYNFRYLPSSHGNCRSTCRHRTKLFEVHYTRVTLRNVSNDCVLSYRRLSNMRPSSSQFNMLLEKYYIVGNQLRRD